MYETMFYNVFANSGMISIMILSIYNIYSIYNIKIVHRDLVELQKGKQCITLGYDYWGYVPIAVLN